MQQAATPQPTPEIQPAKAQDRRKSQIKVAIAILVVAIIVVVAAVYTLGIKGNSTSTSTTTPIIHTSNNSTSSYSLSGCANITSPGSYSLVSRIKTVMSQGACINIKNSNVKLACNGNRLIGSGPFDAVGPFTYGISVDGATNVTISDCEISNFSYGISAYASSRVAILDSNVSSNFMSNIYFNSTVNSTIERNFLARALSWEGSLYLGNKSNSNLVINNTIEYNQVYGVNISSAHETFLHNVVNTTSQVGFYCNPSVSYPHSSTGSGNVCFGNKGCAFLECTGQNLPANISKITLSSGVSGCGSITKSGNYDLEQSIDMGDYLNVSNPSASSQGLPCIAIRANNVNLDCGGHSIYNSTYPIAVYGSSSVSIENCNISYASGVGIAFISSSNSTVSNTVVTRALKAGILIQDSNSDNVTDSTFVGGRYGVIINDSQSDNLLGVNASKNSRYGLYVIGFSIGNNFYNVRSLNNTLLDVYSAPNVSGVQTNFVSGMNCYNTNAHWAPCKFFVVANLGYTPVTSCGAISEPGTYILQSDILNAQDNCVAIRSNKVTFDCGGKSISTTQATSGGYGVTVKNDSGVVVENCTLQNFAGGVYVYNSSGVNVTNVGVWNSGSGIVLNRSRNSVVFNDTVNSSTAYAIRLINSTSNKVEQDTISYGLGGAVGVALNDSRLNSVVNDIVTQYHYGFAFFGRSGNNTVTNNTASISGAYDYFCNGNGGIGSELGGINYGTVKNGCSWMALIKTLSPTPPCVSTSNPDSYSLTSDYVYPYGSVCFTVNNNGTMINCNGHTIIATNGGIFASFEKGSQGSTIENCYLKGFTTAIQAINSSAKIYNNAVQQTTPNTTAILVRGFQYGAISQNNVTGAGTAFALYNTLAATLQNNFAFFSRTGYYVYNATGITINNDYAAASTTNGLVLNATTQGSLKGLTLNSAVFGLSCLGSSQMTTILSDQGGISCNAQSDCGWLHASSGSC
jgi:parallel beta-helix repeat protein